VDPLPTRIEGGRRGPSRNANVGLDSIAPCSPAGAATERGHPGSSSPVFPFVTWTVPVSSPTATIVSWCHVIAVGELCVMVPGEQTSQSGYGQVTLEEVSFVEGHAVDPAAWTLATGVSTTDAAEVRAPRGRKRSDAMTAASTFGGRPTG
jgi:hypothetical protein